MRVPLTRRSVYSSAGWLGALGIWTVSLVVRVWHRADYIPGWDVISAAQGLQLLSTRPLGELVHWQVFYAWHPSVLWNVYGFTQVLLPGMLAALHPWLFWNHTVTFAVSLLVLWLTTVAFELGRRDAWVVLLAWSASPVLVSQSVAGLAYLTCSLPYALAVCTVLRFSARPVVTALLAVLVFVIASQVQELGRTVPLVFLIAAATAPATRATRIVWLVAGALQGMNAIWDPTPNTAFVSNMGSPASAQVLGALEAVGRAVFVQRSLDIPVLIGTGIVSLALVRRARWFWGLLFAAQIGLVVVLGLTRGVGGVWPRRFLLVDLCATFPVVALYAEWRSAGARWRPAVLVAVLLVGAVWQMANTLAFARQPFPREGWAFTLPFVHTTVDYQTVFRDAEWTRRMLADAQAGKKIILAYNFNSWGENPTNPAGIPERLLLSLGYPRYLRTVYFFGTGWRWTELRARPTAEIAPFVAAIDDPGQYVGWYKSDPFDAANPQHRQEVSQLLVALEERFTIIWEEPEVEPEFYFLCRFRLEKKSEGQ
jgi:hypothetical protein